MPAGLRFSGRRFSAADLELIEEVTSTFPALSRTELSQTLCELLAWRRPSGKLKTDECRALLEHLEACQKLTLPALQKTAPKGPRRILRTDASRAQPPLSTSLCELQPLTLDLVQGAGHPGLDLFRQFVSRYHYLGYRVPFGAHLHYLLTSEQLPGQILACLLFSSPAWKMAPRDAWIGWNDRQRRHNLQYLVANSRFLILPWVEVSNLASQALSLAARRLPDDWHRCYGLRPLLLETLVDSTRFRGTCYRAANWIHLGSTQGRGRMDRNHQAHGRAVKDIYVYPLRPDARRRLATSRSHVKI